MINVLIVDDHPIVRAGLKKILVSEPEFGDVAEARDLEEMKKAFNQMVFDVVIMDISLPGRTGFDGVKDLKREHPRVGILVLSIHPGEQFAMRTLKTGASGYLTKDCEPRVLIEAIKQIHAGNRYITPKVAEIVADQVDHPEGQAAHEILSDREFQILLMIGSGRGLTEIANSFALSVKTVSTYRSRILKKMKMKNNAEIIKYVLSSNLKDLPPLSMQA